MGIYINMYSTYSTFWLALEYQEGVSQLFYGIGYCKGSGVIAVTLHCERDRPSFVSGIMTWTNNI